MITLKWGGTTVAVTSRNLCNDCPMFVPLLCVTRIPPVRCLLR